MYTWAFSFSFFIRGEVPTEEVRQWHERSLPWKIGETQTAVALATNIACVNLYFTARQLQEGGLVSGNTDFVRSVFPGTLCCG